MALFAYFGFTPMNHLPTVGNDNDTNRCNQLLPIDDDGKVKMMRLTSRAGYPESGTGPYFIAQKPYSVANQGVPVVMGFTHGRYYPDDWGYSGFNCWKTCHYNYYYKDLSCSVEENQIRCIGTGRYERRYRKSSTTFKVGHRPTHGEVENFMASCSADGPWSKWEAWDRIINLDWVEPTPFEFLYNENSCFETIADTGIIPHGYASGFQTAYVSACQAIPKVDSNGIANIIECLGALKELSKILKGGAIAGLAKAMKNYADPRQAWLAYRYSYTTTKLDLEEYDDFYRRVCSLKDSIQTTIKCDGWYPDGDITYHVSFEVDLSDVLPSSIVEKLNKVGIRPSLSNAWDIIPYSFVVDWVLPVGDLISYFENWSDSVRVYKRNYWFTVVSSYDSQVVFFRVQGRDLNVPPHIVDNPVSDRTIRMRIADAISLFS